MLDKELFLKLHKLSAIKLDEKKSDSFLYDINNMIELVSVVEKIDVDESYYIDDSQNKLELKSGTVDFPDPESLLQNVKHPKSGSSYSISLLIDN